MKLIYFIPLMFKRYLKNPPFAAVLVLIPLCCLFLKGLGFDEEIKIKAGIYSESEISLDTFTAYEGGVGFTIYETPEALKEAVCGREIECGYYFTKNLPKSYEVEAVKNSIICYKSPATAFDKVVNEIIFSELFKAYSLDILKDFGKNKGISDLAALESAYKGYLKSGEVISLDYEYIEEAASSAESINPFAYLKGVFGIYIMLGGILGGFLLIRDIKAGLWKTLAPLPKTLTAWVYFLVPSILCGASAYLGLMLSGTYGAGELLPTALYCLLAAAYGSLVYAFFDKTASLGSALTVILTGSLIFCPIFINTEGLFPAFGCISKLLIPTYYIAGELLAPLLAVLLLSFISLNIKFR